MLAARGAQSDTYYCPDWYALFVAADRCHCPPWQLLEQGVWWQDKAMIALSAEAGARKSLEDH